MKPKQNLFELIKSLNKSEKRYFKLYASLQKGSKNYIKLFDEIGMQEQYDEPAIKEKFKNEVFIKQLTFTKNYLYKLILKSLIAYGGEKSIESRLNELITGSKILLSKGLIKPYFETLNNAYKTACLYERFSYCLQILELKNLYTKIVDYPAGKRGSIAAEVKEVTDKINNYYLYNTILNRLVEIYREAGKIRDSELFNIISEIEALPALKDPAQALSARAKENFYFIHQLISDFKGDDELIYKYTSERLKLISAYPEPFSDLSINYLHDVLSYALSYSARNRNHKKFEHYMKYILSLPVNSISDEISLFFVTSYTNIVMLIKDRRLEEAIALIPGIKQSLGKYRHSVEGDKELLLLYQVMIVYMMAGRYNDALTELNALLLNPNIKLRPEIEWYTRLLSLIIHYELKNYKYLSYLLVSTYRYLHKNKKIFKVERILLNFIKKLPQVKEGEQLRQVLLKLKKELTGLKDDSYEKNAFRYFDFIYWIDTRLGQIIYPDSPASH